MVVAEKQEKNSIYKIKPLVETGGLILFKTNGLSQEDCDKLGAC
jgi:hypothetical protein